MRPHVTTLSNMAACDRLLCIQCGKQVREKMTFCHSRLGKEEWNRFFAGTFEDYIMVTEYGRYSALCPSHVRLVGEILGGGAYEIAEDMPCAQVAKKIKALHLESLSRHLFDSRDDGGDFTITCGSKELKAHRSILAAASPVFQAMISSDMVEGRTLSLVMTDADERDVLALLRFIYTGELGDDTNYCAVLRLADKYNVETLIQLCCTRISTVFNSSTAVEIVRTLRASQNQFMVATFEVISEKIGQDPKLCAAVLRQL